MKFRAITALLLTAALAVPSAAAATVEILPNQMCKLSYTQQDLNDLRSIVSQDQGTLVLLKAEFPEIGNDFDLLLDEIASELISVQYFHPDNLTPAAQATFFTYFSTGLGAGFSVDDLLAMLIASIFPSLIEWNQDQKEDQMLGSFHVTTALAQVWIDNAEGLPGGFGFDFRAGTFHDVQLNARTLRIIQPSGVLAEEYAHAFAQPFQACIDGIPIDEEPDEEVQLPNPPRGSSLSSS